jgi:hypothetical protein
MQEIQYNPVAFDGVTPVLDVGDPSAAFLESVKFSTQGMKENFKSDMTQYLRNQEIEEKNLEKEMEDMKGLMDLSEKASKTYLNYQNQKTKKKLSEIWAVNFNAPVNIDEEKLAADYTAEEDAQAEVSQEVGEKLSENLNKKEEPTVQDIADAGRIRKYSGLEGVVAANARAEAAMQSYGPALAKFLGKVQPEPGAKTEATIAEFNARWSDATGMSAANPGYTAKHVYPALRREAAAENDAYTRGWNVAEASKQKDILLQGLSTGDVTLDSYFVQMKGLTRADGKTLMNNDDVWASLKGKFDTDQLTQMGSATFAVTGKPYASHPRFAGLLMEARQRRNQAYNLGRAESRAMATQAFNALGPNATRAQMDAERDRLLAANVPLDIVDAQLTSARRSSTEAQIVRQESDRIKAWANANPGKKIPLSVIGDAPLVVRQQFAGQMDQSAEDETTSEMIRDTQIFKDFGKDFKSTIKTVVKNMRVGSALTGTPDPVNYNEFKTQSLNDIVNRTYAKMLSDGSLTAEQAFAQARDEWRKDTMAKQAAGTLYDGKNHTFVGAQKEGTAQIQEAATRLMKTPIDKLGEVLDESDIQAPTIPGRYSDHVKLLERSTGLTPKEIVDRARAQQGLPALENTPADDARQMVDKPTSAKISYVENPPSQLALRAQINSGQRLVGTARQRTVAVGQQLLEMGYGGIWQHPDFNYDSGYTGTGQEKHFRQGYNSAHNHGEALDIGLAANSPQKLEMIYQYLLKNKERFGVRELFYAPKGSGRYDPDGSHWHHVHVSFDHRTSG